jgi:hypothetical protein
VTQAGLAGTLSEGSYTIFAPTDDAFSKLGPEMLDAVLADSALLTDILLYHVVDEELLSTDLECNGSIRMANAKETTTVCANDCLYQKGVGNSWESLPRIISQDLRTCNGKIHVLNQVLLPDMVDRLVDTVADESETTEESEEMMPPEQDENDETAPTTCSTIGELNSPSFKGKQSRKHHILTSSASFDFLSVNYCRRNRL